MTDIWVFSFCFECLVDSTDFKGTIYQAHRVIIICIIIIIIMIIFVFVVVVDVVAKF